MKKIARLTVTLLTDFGIFDQYVAVMKGVILQLSPNVQLVDISHEVQRHNILDAAYLLSQSAPYFPKGTIHLVVVDPDVGTTRRRLAIQGSRSYYVGPDNGVLTPAASAEGIVKAVSITEEKYMRKKISCTFEGRDIFAPAAAYLALGLDIEELGFRVSDMVFPPLNRPERLDDKIRGKIIHIDRFGNLVTNIPDIFIEEWLPSSHVVVTIDRRSVEATLTESYAKTPIGSLIVLAGSSGLVEVAINRESAQNELHASVGLDVEIQRNPI